MTKKGQIGQITKLIESSGITDQEAALDDRFSKKFVTRSFKVIEGQKSLKV